MVPTGRRLHQHPCGEMGHRHQFLYPCLPAKAGQRGLTEVDRPVIEEVSHLLRWPHQILLEDQEDSDSPANVGTESWEEEGRRRDDVYHLLGHTHPAVGLDCHNHSVLTCAAVAGPECHIRRPQSHAAAAVG